MTSFRQLSYVTTLARERHFARSRFRMIEDVGVSPSMDFVVPARESLPAIVQAILDVASAPEAGASLRDAFDRISL